MKERVDKWLTRRFSAPASYFIGGALVASMVLRNALGWWGTGSFLAATGIGLVLAGFSLGAVRREARRKAAEREARGDEVRRNAEARREARW